ncbi:MAG: 1-acyl-sn-glycerol-3-phosphate acyltransferase [Lachnospiraceae bacterium]|nr:1-acyl-sn-glycerol-3-phosphate acyltransferase [Lachnospiraceae bacterium]
MKKFSYHIYKMIKGAVWFFYPKMKVEGIENLPDEASVIVGNHSQMNGPIVGELYFPKKFSIWCIAEMMDAKLVPAYAFEDFWSKKPLYIRWFYKILSYIIAPIAQCVFTNADTIPVYKDKRILTTFKETAGKLKEGLNVIIFPEDYDEHNNIVHKFQEGFVNVAKMYYKETGKDVSFVPMYICPALKKVVFGKPVLFNHEAPMKEEQERICNYLMDEISEVAYSLPRHRVVPYPNISKKDYPYSDRL